MNSIMHARDAQPATVWPRHTITIAHMIPTIPRNTVNRPKPVMTDIGLVDRLVIPLQPFPAACFDRDHDPLVFFYLLLQKLCKFGIRCCHTTPSFPIHFHDTGIRPPAEDPQPLDASPDPSDSILILPHGSISCHSEVSENHWEKASATTHNIILVFNGNYVTMKISP